MFIIVYDKRHKCPVFATLRDGLSSGEVSVAVGMQCLCTAELLVRTTLVLSPVCKLMETYDASLQELIYFSVR